MDTPATSWKHPAFSPLNAEARQPTLASGVFLCLALWLPPPTDNEVMLYREGGHNHERNCRIPRLYKPPLHFVLRLRLQKVGRICGTLRYSITQYRWVLRYSPCRIKQNLQQTDPAWESTVSMDKHHPLLQTRVSVTQLVRASDRHSEEPMAISSMSFSHTNPSLKHLICMH